MQQTLLAYNKSMGGIALGSRRYHPECKDESARQVLEPGQGPL